MTSVSLEVQGQDTAAVFADGAPVGTVRWNRNPFHSEPLCLSFALLDYRTEWAKPLTEALKSRWSGPFQASASSDDRDFVEFLKEGGFQCRRRCFEVDGLPQRAVDPEKAGSLSAADRGTPEYVRCCGMMYCHYEETHRNVSPLTADLASFCQRMTDRVLYQGRHCAFVEGAEIAYIATEEPETFTAFAEAVLAAQLAEHGTVWFEADNCDWAAMELKRFFRDDGRPSFDTYILDP